VVASSQKSTTTRIPYPMKGSPEKRAKKLGAYE
jgi:hypothetical protein